MGRRTPAGTDLSERLATRRVLCALAVSLQLILSQISSARSAERPNIVLIMADDMGFSDIGCYGGEIETPVLDGLAAKGLRLTQFYNTGRCCPTRASLLTGLYPHQAGIGHMMGDDGLPSYSGNLSPNCVTIAEALKPAGYGCYVAGKWHVARHIQPDGPKDDWPLQRGFDRFYGTIHGAGSFYDPNSLTRDNQQISPVTDPEYQPETYYYTDAISDHAARFVREHHEKRPDDPFFCYVAYTAAHWPMHALPEDVEKYKGRYDKGYAAVRQARVVKMRELGLLDSNWDVTPTVGDWDGVTNRAWELRCMEVYAAMVDRMDEGIGKIVESLKTTGRFDNTLILFLQDNGGCAEGLGRRPRNGLRQRAEKPLAPMKPDELQFSMIPAKTRDGWPLLMGPGVMPGPADTYIAYGRDWANVSNTPFREYKHWVHEGGISTPLIAHWPNGIGAEGDLSAEPSHLIDLMATCVDVGNARYPKERNGEPVTPLEGKSLRGLFEVGARDGHQMIFWEHEGNRAVRNGKWKLVSKHGQPWELYDMQADRTEMHDLAKKEPVNVQILEARYEAWAERAGVMPWDELQQHRRERRRASKPNRE